MTLIYKIRCGMSTEFFTYDHDCVRCCKIIQSRDNLLLLQWHGCLDNYGLKSCIAGQSCKNNVSGRKHWPGLTVPVKAKSRVTPLK